MTRFYRALLRLYPASFRADYGDELTRTFKEQTHYRSRAGAMLAAITDVVPNAACARPALRAAGIHPISVLRSD